MKNFKSLVITLLLYFISNAQTGKNPTNKLPKGPIKINGVAWEIIVLEIRADEAKIKKLFGNDMKKRIERGGAYDLDHFESKKKGLSLAFYGERGIYYLDSFSITNRNSNITILGVTLTIGDSINKLKNVKIDYKYNLISFSDGDAGALHIEFNPKTKKITKIYYTTWA